MRARIEELSEIEDAFEVDKRNKLHGKTILDVGTDWCSKAKSQKMLDGRFT